MKFQNIDPRDALMFRFLFGHEIPEVVELSDVELSDVEPPVMIVPPGTLHIWTRFDMSCHEWRPLSSEFDKLYRRHLKSLSVRKRTKLLIKHYVLKQ